MALLVIMLAGTAQAQTVNYSHIAAPGSWGTATQWIPNMDGGPNAAAASLSKANSGSAIATTLDVSATVGRIENASTGSRHWTIQDDGTGHAITFDNTGATTPGNALLRSNSNTSALTVNANIVIANTDLNITSGGSQSGSAATTVGAVGGTTTIIATSARSLNLGATFSKPITIHSSIGVTGSAINLTNTSGSTTSTAQVVLNGEIGAQVSSIVQNGASFTGANSPLFINAANPSFTGSVTVQSGTLSVGASGSLGNSNTITVNDGATLVLANSTALGASSYLKVSAQGSVTLNYSGTLSVDSFSTTGGASKVAPGLWGPVGSAATNQTARLTGSGLVQVTGVNPDSDGDGLDDAWEINYFGNITAQDGSGDPDGDGFSNLLEHDAGTDPTLTAQNPDDKDADGLRDAWEQQYFGNLAQGASDDADGDGATNLEEQNFGINGTDPISVSSYPDADSDGLIDAWEIAYFGNLATSDASGDADSDGATNAQEMAAGSSPINVNSTPTKAVLAHRWSFNGDLLDSVGTFHATIVDPDANAAVGGVVTQGASEITLGGGASTTSAAVELGANLLGGRKTPVTVELWATQNQTQNWSRIFEFGSSPGENLFMAWSNASTNTKDRVSWTDSVASLANDTVAPYTLGVKYHVVFTLTPAPFTAGAVTRGTRVTWYVVPSSSTANVALKGSFDTNNLVAALNDIHGWLGRSTGTDNVASATYDEVRIWDGALTLDEINTHQLAGPDAFTIVDTDSDGLSDPLEISLFGDLIQGPGDDFDDDGSTNLFEIQNAFAPNNYLSSPDTDSDTLPDGWEIHYFKLVGETGLADGATIIGRQDGTSDSDGDLFTNAQEYFWLTDPTIAASVPGDYNNDGVNDGPILLAVDALNESSFNAGLHWSDGSAPVDTKAYFVSVNGLRSPVLTGDLTFAGNRLILTTRGTSVGNFNWFTTGALTFPLLQLDGGVLNQSVAAVVTLNGNVSITANSTIAATTGAITVNAALAGTGNLNLNGANNVTFAGPSTWTGSLAVATGANRFTLDSTGVLKFVPGASGVTNNISGAGAITLNGQFVIDTSGASSTSGAAWMLVASTGAKTYGAGFTVAGFTADAAVAGARKWTSGVYSFDEATGVLSVVGPALTNLEDWRLAYFGSSANTGTGADAFDADADGIANLIEYATGTVPTAANSDAPATVAELGGVLTLTFNHIDDPDLDYVVEASSNLTVWTPVATYTGFAASGSTTYTDDADLTVAGARRFLRLKITP